jgi:hypothetical protein
VEPIAAKTRGKLKNTVSSAQLLKRMNQLADMHNSSNAQIIQELNSVRVELEQMKEALNREKTRPETKRRGSLFRGRRAEPEQLEPEKPKLSIPLGELLPLLPHLGGVIPYLMNPKVAESMKILSNPAVITMIQQFLANGGLNVGHLHKLTDGGVSVGKR